jgi:phosphate transport system substrate-binding protein
VNPENPLASLTKAQVRRIYSGEVTNWAELGGAAGEIRPFLRELGSSTRASFEQYFFDGKPTYSARVIEVFGSANETVHSFKGAIAMVTVQKSNVEDRSIKLVAVDGVAATTANVNSGSYPIRRPIHLLALSDQGQVSLFVRAFFSFILGPEGQAIRATF